MHRIDCPTATPDNRFTEGDPTIPVAATTVTADWLNAVQEELCAVIAAAGLPLEKANNLQLYLAICKIIRLKVPLASVEAPGLMQVGAGLKVTEEGLVSVDQKSRAIPVGFVGAFSGSFGGEDNRYPVPPGSEEPDLGWCLCDGVLTNGLPVPDLRGRMILGANTARPAGSAGGAETHTHSVSGTVGGSTLSVAQLATHRHNLAATLGGVNGTIENPFDHGSTNLTDTDAVQNSGSSQSHTHTLTASSGAASHLPPYYTLAFIMRCA